MRRFLTVMPLAIVLLVPSVSVASPITLHYSGSWQFFDPPSDTPDFHAAMGAYGVVFGAANPLSFSLTINPLVSDSDPSPSTGLYLGAVVSSQLTIGSLSLSCAGPACSAAVPNFGGPVGGALISPNSVQMVGSLSSLPPLAGGLFTPSFFSFQSFPSLASDSLVSAMASAGSWPTPQIIIGFQGSGLNLGTSNLNLVSVPEASTYTTLVGGLLVLFFLHRRRSRAPKQFTS